MINTNVITHHRGQQIRFTNNCFGNAKLFIEGECRDIYRKAFAPINKPVLRTRNGTDLIEVFVQAIWTVKVKICVNGQHIYGDAF